MWWIVMIMVIVILALFGEMTLENNWTRFLFEIRLKSEWPRFNFPIFRICRYKAWQ